MKNLLKYVSFCNIMIFLLCTFISCHFSGCGLKEMGTISRKEYIDSPKTALLIIDIQYDYFPGGKFELKGVEEASIRAKKVLEFFRKKDLHIIHIQHESTEDPPSVFAPNSEGQKIHENVLPLPGETVFTKHLVSSFDQTPLLDHLKKNEINRLVIAGMQTNVCVLGTVIGGIKNEFEIVVLKDAAAARDFATHNETLLAIEAEGAKLATVDELIMD